MSLRKVFWKGNKIGWFLFAFFMILDSGINLFLSIILQQFTDVAVEKDIQRLKNLCILCVVSFVVILLLSMAQYYTEAKFLKRAMLQYKNTIFSELLKKSRKSFHKESTGTYISALTNDATIIETNYLRGTVQMISYGVAFVATIVMMIVYSPMLTLVAILLAFLPILISMLSSNRLVTEENTVSEYHANFVDVIKDMLMGFTVIKSFRAEKRIEEIYKKENHFLENAKFRRGMIKGGIGLLSTSGVLVSQIGIFIVGAFLAYKGNEVTAGTLIAFVNMMGALMTPLSVIPQLYGGRKAAIVLIEKIEVAVNENITENIGKVLTDFNKGISLNNVSFGYTAESNTLKDISIKFEAGKSYAIVGGSGCGKSTVLDVLMGNYGNYLGEIYYDGMELKEISVDSLYDLLSVVQQGVFVFDSTIRDNITMFEDFPDEQIMRAIELSGLSKLIEEKGTEYLCGENGCNLSGGEKQRISIARCLLRKTPILVADEATASLDAKTAYEVMNSILEMEDLTRIIVTHQLEEALLKKYDKIIVMKNGTVEEQGTFEELLERKQYFYSLYNVSI